MRIILYTLIILLSGCGTVSKILPDDRRNEYRTSEPLPDLEVPPDLTAASENQSMNIPGETEASLADYQRIQEQRNNSSTTVQQPVTNNDDNFVVVNGSSTTVWPQLRSFFSEKGYTFNLDDADMGVLGTEWQETSDNQSRIRYKIFSEPGAEPGLIVLYISNNIQNNTGGSWEDAGKDISAERLITGELNLYLGNQPSYPSSTIASSSSATSSASANIEYTNDGAILYLPNEFTYAWVETEKAIQKAGLVINKSNQSMGIYTVAYYDAQVQVEEKKGFVSKLAFWRKDDKPAEGELYDLSLTGAGDKTELIVLNENGQWENSNAAEQIVQLIRDQYAR